ncbi:MAG: alpha/beta hydrolase [Rubrivivax sp.]|nr:alpha/beta hydrolase [Rubrivivax sp.]HNE60702.1 alpha/beta hydrolase [Ottowia sp.]HNI84116.1 alpha/beta hydrolase [Ottowia sp.]HNJ46684.1 alpha/beta hydrolase [Ottowia sp.]HNL41656.1 alpha/beta hydrolase [Ottowia sp.]
MNAQTESLTLRGPAGAIEALLDRPAADGAARGTAVIAHPHPQFGGTMSNKVVQTLARACVQCGWRAVRFNFRGVGASAGQYDHGQGEQDDLLAVVAQQAAADQALLLAGFSFGAFVASQAIARLHPQRALAGAVLVGTAASRFDVAPLPPALHAQTLVVHGEHDETVPLTSVMDWARPQLLPVTVVPGGGHFFHGQLPLLKGLVERHLRAL